MSQSMASAIDRSQQQKVLIVAGVSTGFSTLIVALRFISRYYVTKLTGADDWLMLLGLISAISLTIETFIDSRYGLGLHLIHFQVSWIIPYLKLFFSIEISYHMSMTFIKLSILTFYLRILSADTLTRRLTWMTMILVASFGFINILVLFVQCIPLNKFWDKATPGRCRNMLVLYYFSASLNIATDIILERQDKGLLFIWGNAICVPCQSITAFVSSKDSTWEVVELNAWSHIEIASAIFCACIPALKGLLVRKKREDTSVAPVLLYPVSDSNKWGYNKQTDAQNTSASTSS